MNSEPTEKQMALIKSICKTLWIDIPEKLTKETAQKFISNNMVEYRYGGEFDGAFDNE